MSKSPKSWSSQNSNSLYKAGYTLLYALLFIAFKTPAQVVNYVNNGGFEECSNCLTTNISYYAKYWAPIDSAKYCYYLFSELPPDAQVPKIGYAYQWPKSGYNYILSTLYYKPNTSQTGRGYPRNTLKQNLEAGKTYCVKFYCNITNQSSYGVDGLGAYFGNNNTDTITQSDKPITYLTPQVQNPSGNILKDTLNWVLISGTFTATGNEKYLILGNFKSDAATNSILINPTNLPTIGTDVLYDDVSCIALDLPADAGDDVYMIPGDSAFIGRQPDVGIDEACTWYQLPNTSTPIANVAGLWVKPANTTTYVVKQDICGILKWDTVVVYKSAVGFEALKLISEDLKIYPVPASDALSLRWEAEGPEKEFTGAEIINGLGQVVQINDLKYQNKQVNIDLKNLPEGVYSLKLTSSSLGSISKRFIINR